MTQIILERRRAGREGEDFLQTLMDARYRSGSPLTEHEITGMLVAALFAGHHTSSVTTAWSIIELVNDPAYLARVLDELDGVFAGGEEVGFQSLRNIPLTERAVLEVLRLHPPLFMLVRVAMEDFVHAGYFIPKGTWVLISPTVSHRIPELFRDAEAFDPDRFAPPREEDKRDFAFIPFGGGRHKCMGNAFALLQIKAILAILLRRYTFEARRAARRVRLPRPGGRAQEPLPRALPAPRSVRPRRAPRRRGRRGPRPALPGPRSISTSASRATGPARARRRRCSASTGWAR